jgi:hypothetical protein
MNTLARWKELQSKTDADWWHQQRKAVKFWREVMAKQWRFYHGS